MEQLSVAAFISFAQALERDRTHAAAIHYAQQMIAFLQVIDLDDVRRFPLDRTANDRATGHVHDLEWQVAARSAGTEDVQLVARRDRPDHQSFLRPDRSWIDAFGVHCGWIGSGGSRSLQGESMDRSARFRSTPSGLSSC